MDNFRLAEVATELEKPDSAFQRLTDKVELLECRIDDLDVIQIKFYNLDWF